MPFQLFVVIVYEGMFVCQPRQNVTSEWVDQGLKCVDDCHPSQNVNKNVSRSNRS